ncbi:MAG: ATP-binding protein [Candidatus Margulisbacteria bacterium]|nr:ATP-binding protein [Candidatus Margulisiibacteriota bacterium]
MQYWPREIENTLKRAVEQFSAVILTGPRQSGKTTLFEHFFKQSHNYVTLDDPQIRALAIADPKLFLEKYPAPLIIDEIQYAPSLLPYIKIEIDTHRAQKGLFLLTGSQQFPLMQGVTESLAGRCAVLTLLPMNWQESRFNQLPINNNISIPLFSFWVRGAFPELAANPELDSNLWYAGYLQTYLERDVRGLRQIGNLSEFQIFLQMCAARNAQLLNLSSISKDLGIAVNTIKAWINILEASQQIYSVRPYYNNKGKRLIKAPKLFFTDTGLCSHLVGLKDPVLALQGNFAGPLAESAVFGELLKFYHNRGLIPAIYFWRTAGGDEVDFIIELNNKIVPIEVKITKTPTLLHAAPINTFCKLFQKEVNQGMVVCLSDTELPLANNIMAIPFVSLAKHLSSL